MEKEQILKQMEDNKRKKRKTLFIVLGVLAVFLIIGIVGCSILLVTVKNKVSDYIDTIEEIDDDYNSIIDSTNRVFDLNTQYQLEFSGKMIDEIDYDKVEEYMGSYEEEVVLLENSLNRLKEKDIISKIDNNSDKLGDIQNALNSFYEQVENIIEYEKNEIESTRKQVKIQKEYKVWKNKIDQIMEDTYSMETRQDEIMIGDRINEQQLFLDSVIVLAEQTSFDDEFYTEYNEQFIKMLKGEKVAMDFLVSHYLDGVLEDFENGQNKDADVINTFNTFLSDWNSRYRTKVNDLNNNFQQVQDDFIDERNLID